MKRVNQLVKEELSKIVFREFGLPKDVLATLTRVETAPDLRDAKIYISCLPEEQADAVISQLNEKTHFIQKLLNKRLKMKFTPRLKFSQEKDTIAAGRVEEILEKLKKGRS